MSEEFFFLSGTHTFVNQNSSCPVAIVAGMVRIVVFVFDVCLQIIVVVSL